MLAAVLKATAISTQVSPVVLVAHMVTSMGRVITDGTPDCADEEPEFLRHRTGRCWCGSCSGPPAPVKDGSRAALNGNTSTASPSLRKLLLEHGDRLAKDVDYSR